MGDNVFVNADRTEVVEQASPGKKYQMRRKEAQRLGLLPEGDAKPQARRNAPEDTTRDLTAPREDTQRSVTISTAVRATPKKAAKK